MKKHFIDTNIIIYANDSRDKKKQDIALALTKKLMSEGNGVISTQVLQEYAHVAITRLGQDHSVVMRQIILLGNLETVTVTADIVKRSLELQKLYQINFWDAGIIAAAETANCDSVLTEDLNTGQLYSGIRAINPFKP
ncbi:MAG: PIN domain-containing protein [Victivallales bacterium]|jgi:predicted nucleic acid-binding protein